jgi:hypothetical protein
MMLHVVVVLLDLGVSMRGGFALAPAVNCHFPITPIHTTKPSAHHDSLPNRLSASLNGLFVSSFDGLCSLTARRLSPVSYADDRLYQEHNHCQLYQNVGRSFSDMRTELETSHELRHHQHVQSELRMIVLHPRR